MTTSELLRPHEVCRILGVSRSWLYQAAADGRIPHIRLGSDDGPVRFVPAEIEQWLDNARREWRPRPSAPRDRRARCTVSTCPGDQCCPWFEYDDAGNAQVA